MVRSSTSLEELDPALYTEASLCCGCGICEIAACCQDISPRAVIYEMKSKLAAKKLRYTPPADASGYIVIKSESATTFLFSLRRRFTTFSFSVLFKVQVLYTM